MTLSGLECCLYGSGLACKSPSKGHPESVRTHRIYLYGSVPSTDLVASYSVLILVCFFSQESSFHSLGQPSEVSETGFDYQIVKGICGTP